MRLVGSIIAVVVVAGLGLLLGQVAGTAGGAWRHCALRRRGHVFGWHLLARAALGLGAGPFSHSYHLRATEVARLSAARQAGKSRRYRRHIARMALEILLFRSLFRNSRSEMHQQRLVIGEDKYLWLGALAFHWSMLVIVLRHLRLLVEPVPGLVLLLQKLDGFFQLGVPEWYLSDILIVLALLYLLVRRWRDPAVRYISLFTDYFARLPDARDRGDGNSDALRGQDRHGCGEAVGAGAGDIFAHRAGQSRRIFLCTSAAGERAGRVFPVQQAGAHGRRVPESRRATWRTPAACVGISIRGITRSKPTLTLSGRKSSGTRSSRQDCRSPPRQRQPRRMPGKPLSPQLTPQRCRLEVARSPRVSELLQIETKPPQGDWRDPKVEFRKGTYSHSALPKNLNYLGLPNRARLAAARCRLEAAARLATHSARWHAGPPEEISLLPPVHGHVRPLRCLRGQMPFLHWFGRP